MAPSGEDELEWIEKVRSGGNVPLYGANGKYSNCWDSPHGDKFLVRGPEYFSTKAKVPAGESILKPLGFDWIRSSAKIGEILNHPNNRIQKAINDSFPTGPRPFIWAFNLQLPNKQNYNLVSYFVSTEPIVKGSLIDQFLKGDDHFRNSRLKLIADIVKGPWIVKKAIGNQAVCVVGRVLSCKYIVRDNFFEVDIDVGSNIMARAMFHLAFDYFTALTADIAFFIEGKTKCELPERLLGCFRFSDLNPASAMPMESDAG
ncbi:protein ENHANCED DISEASE RESISTANCE 2-like [Cucurbita pepo subsp. pepo]|uniref:protein ENHANCED DISEASE RESISTANCE 2-like n=1 Tax=Cucurbita pepo subsp. pepo TaxID=3664 RepID=UPI000C9D7A24|nr:protein ENHANCED DISEASE RESISTANCE 2-like [Cucurbita pepo subsp. pepo]XP_023526311.1 protein ENHANCED DISEASE RESISTANCE 2-like [Cucurbita pepo subsp. pepo]XP_023526313.1 protein ENHANCED DISEASE RESISTANCE 2-like [Cucurbita pepo subsp. pepo]XP_023526314.1 protein ENHANCED DISEASE RESISTANCE 2-like [Cucurbita pepo subsp. pepo]